jgi:hypothetical protein
MPSADHFIGLLKAKTGTAVVSDTAGSNEHYDRVSLVATPKRDDVRSWPTHKWVISKELREGTQAFKLQHSRNCRAKAGPSPRSRTIRDPKGRRCGRGSRKPCPHRNPRGRAHR